MSAPLKKCVYCIALLLISVRSIAQDECVNYISAVPLYDPQNTGRWDPLWNFPTMKQTKVTSLNFATYFRGLLEYKPSDYNAGNSTTHPLIIFFHGRASRGFGTASDLCRLFRDNDRYDSALYKALPGRVERNTSEFTQGSNKFIVVSPQYWKYERVYPDINGTNGYPSAASVEAVIDYVLARYPNKINTNKIYLTGYSGGANMIMEYVGSSLARARRIAAVIPVSLCSQLYHFSNTNIGVDAANIANAGLNTWFINCKTDDACKDSIPTNWINAIKANGGATPRYTLLNASNPNPLYQCSDTITHDAWSRAYDPNFKASFVNGTGANDGINQNVYQWMIAQSNAVLPVVMKSYNARLVNNYVELTWTTTDEKNNSHFTIERAGPDQKFKSIGTVKGAGDNTGERNYSFRDESPLPGLSHYRLSQTDIDGKTVYFDIKKIINRSGEQNAVIVSPNPFNSALSAFINLGRSQKVFISVTDMTGKILKSTSGVYGQGSSEIKISSNDLSSGVYLFKISGEDFSTTQKVVKK